MLRTRGGSPFPSRSDGWGPTKTILSISSSGSKGRGEEAVEVEDGGGHKLPLSLCLSESEEIERKTSLVHRTASLHSILWFFRACLGTTT